MITELINKYLRENKKLGGLDGEPNIKRATRGRRPTVGGRRRLP